jgi:hypothetical protein
MFLNEQTKKSTVMIATRLRKLQHKGNKKNL